MCTPSPHRLDRCSGRCRRSWLRPLVAVLLAFALVPAAASTAVSAESLPHSNTFDGWTVARSGGAQVAFTAQLEGHTGSALQIVNRSGLAPNVFGTITQVVPVQPSTRYVFTAMVKSTGVPSGGVQAIVSPDWGQRFGFPAGEYDWREISWTAHTAAGQTVLPLRILSQDATAGFLIDDLTMRAEGTDVDLLTNGGFDAHSVYFGVTNDTLLFDPGAAQIELYTDASGPADVSWTVRDVHGMEVASGTTPYTNGRANVGLADLGNGFYYFDAESRTGDGAASLSTSFGVVPEMPAEAQEADSPFGVGIHNFDAPLVAAMARLGFAHARTDVTWSNVEHAPGVYDFPARYVDGFAALAAAGIEPLPISNYRNPLYDDNRTPSTPEGLAAYGRYTAAVNQQFSDHTDAVEIYNEFNINFNDGLCGRTPACYVELLRAAATEVDAQNPDAVLVGPAIAGASEDYVRRVLELGGADVLDAVSIHPYRYPATPEGMETQMASMVDVIADAAGRDLPLWLTEYGWPTHEGGGTSDTMQADYLVRAAALSLLGGADRIYWYDVRDDGTDATEKEHNFGLFEHEQAAVRFAAEPKPAAVAQAVLSAELAGLRPVGSDDVGHGSHSVVFADNERTTRVMWSTEPGATASIETKRPVVVVDQYGVETRLAPHAGTVLVGLSEHPVFVRGDVDEIDVGTDGPLLVEAPASVAEGDTATVTVTLDREGENCRAVPPVATVRLGGEEHRLRAAACARTEASFALPTATGQATTRLTGTAALGRRPFAYLTTPTVSITEPVVVSSVVRQQVDQGAFGAEVVISVANNTQSTTLQFTGVEWTRGDAAGTAGDDAAIAPQARLEVAIPLEGMELWQHDYLHAQVTFDGIKAMPVTQSVGVGPIEPDGATSAPPIDIDRHAVWSRYFDDWDGPSDLGGELSFTETSEGLRVRAEIEDDVFRQENPAGSLYNGDSIQVSISPASPGSSVERTEIGLALTPDGPEAYTFDAFGVALTGRTPTADLTVTREGTTTVYDVVLPWSSLGFASAPDGPFALSFIVNDDDGAGRDGYLEWSSGIGRTKDASQHFPVQLISKV